MRLEFNGRSRVSSSLDVVRSVYSAFAAGDIPSVLATLSAAIQWTEAEGGPDGRVFVGPQAVLEQDNLLPRSALT
jgi:hypothetical protein